MLAWGNRVAKSFRDRVRAISVALHTDADYLMACMAFESGGTFSPTILNAAGSGAVGLIQFMPGTAQALGTSTVALARMSAISQLDYVEKYFLSRAGKLRTLDDVYMAILWPAAIGKAANFVLFSKADPDHPKRYVQNAGLDWSKDGQITKGEAALRVRECLTKGQRVENALD